MLSEAVAFVGLLRRAGVRVGVSEVRDFLEAVSLAGTGRQELFWVMEATLIKRESQRKALERLFRLFWEGRPPGDNTAASTGAQPAPLRMDRDHFLWRLQSLKDFIRNERQRLLNSENNGCRAGAGAGPASGRTGAAPQAGETPDPEKFVSLILDGGRECMRALAVTALEQLPVDELEDRELDRQVRILTGWAEGGKILANMVRGGALKDWRQAEERLNLFGEILAYEKDRLIWQKDQNRVLSVLNTAEAPFNSLDYQQSMEIRSKLVMLGRRLAARKGYRYAPSARGRVDLRRTAALAGRHGGVPAKLLMRDRKPARPEMVILCDLSGSVSPFSRFMLLLVSAMQDKFRAVRSFAFVDAVEEVTPLIRGWDAGKKIAEILRKTRIWQTGFSDYGSVWRQFEDNYMDVVGSRSTLVILGDARNNYKPGGIDHFARIAGRARRVIWLNPAPAEEWNREDSIISAYAPYCSAVMECRNLDQLERVARNVLI